MKSIIHRLIVLMLLISASISFGQTTLNNTCKSQINTAQQALYQANMGNFSANSQYCIKLYIHVIKQEILDGSGGYNLSDVQEAIQTLEDDFSPHQIYFNWDVNEIEYIYNSEWYNTVPLSTGQVFSWNNNTDGIDIYMFDENNEENGGLWDLGTGVIVSGTFWATPTGGSVAKSSILSHEVGHVLGLLHTFAGCEGYGWEDEPGNTCLNSGDYVCDTPEDPNMDWNVNGNNCSWSGISDDCSNAPPSGTSFNPSVNNIMAYTHINCMHHFTQGQGERMRNMISSDINLSQLMTECPSGICPQTLTINQNVTDSGFPDIQEADISVLAKNKIESDASAAYDAGQSVTLGKRFHAKAGSTFRAYIDGCSQIGSPRGTAEPFVKEKETYEDIRVYPNPAKNLVNLSHSYLNIQSYILYDIHGRKVGQLNNIKNTKQTIDVAKFGKGIYILNITLEDNTVVTKQLILD